MEIIIQVDSQKASLIAAQIVADVVRKKPMAVLGLATGNTPLQLYKYLIQMHREDGLNFGRVTTFNLDEYIGLAADHPSSCYTYMKQHLFNHINVAKERIHVPDGMTKDIPAYCRHYEEMIKNAGGIDVQILGIGTDGHIGFNEPSSSLASRTQIRTLTNQSRKDNAVFFGGEENVPYHVITMGVETILEAQTCLLLAFGKKKSQAIAQTVEGPVTAFVPASSLQMHRDAKIILDTDAASELKKADYYQWAFDHKPDWQKY